MSHDRITSFFHKSFRGISRPHREQILCAMIRINYGTPWSGDLEILKNFFPEWFHNQLFVGGLTQLIETLSPFTDDPTDHGIVDIKSTSKRSSLDNTASIDIHTTDIIL